MFIAPTIERQVEYGRQNQINHRNLNEILNIRDNKTKTNILLPFNSFYAKFRDYFDKYMMIIPLSEKEQRRYRFSPKKISLDFYHTVDYWDLILYINECHSILEFEPVNVRLVLNDKIKDLIRELMMLDNN